ncbi:hypothetical protein FGO68_gene13321 [Halteria grandinella]|uniref:Uncharacterized protein n=1 Tax=Halteria grandinella TaxID=5974 RepID=A0A8J8P7I6_HALGN|nr:hypothetical protein FGO68_gene13321 [Halteria grandinella]
MIKTGGTTSWGLPQMKIIQSHHKMRNSSKMYNRFTKMCKVGKICSQMGISGIVPEIQGMVKEILETLLAAQGIVIIIMQLQISLCKQSSSISQHRESERCRTNLGVEAIMPQGII